MKKLFVYLLLVISLASCRQESALINVSGTIDEVSPLAATMEGVVLPPDIAPLNFMLPAEDGQEGVTVRCGDRHLSAIVKQGAATPALSDWQELLAGSEGQTLTVSHCVRREGRWLACQPFEMQVAKEPIDSFLTYRLIPPGYEKWFDMSIRQRNLTNYDERVIAANAGTDRNCMNCHSFCAGDASRMTMHVRGKHGGTLLVHEGKATMFDPRSLAPGRSFVYPYWHPSGRYIAYSMNDTKQLFHTHDANRIEVMDLASDIVVYDIGRGEALTTPLLTDTMRYETFPCFSPDGRWLYFCSADRRQMPDEYAQVRYDLCRIAFDATTGTFGDQVETVLPAASDGYSASLPRISPDGRWLIYTHSQYGQFMIWHQDADLWRVDLAATDTLDRRPLTLANAPGASDSYHTWSSNSRWVVFSSRRDDGLYTRPYIAYIDSAGVAHRPFRLPQQEGDFYDRLMYSYNVPELSRSAVTTDLHETILNH